MSPSSRWPRIRQNGSSAVARRRSVAASSDRAAASIAARRSRARDRTTQTPAPAGDPCRTARRGPGSARRAAAGSPVLAARSKLRQRVLTDRPEHRESLLAGSDVRADEAVVDERFQHGEDVRPADGDSAASASQPSTKTASRRNSPLVVVEQVVAPVDRRLERSLALRAVARAADQQRQPFSLQPRQQRLRGRSLSVPPRARSRAAAGRGARTARRSRRVGRRPRSPPSPTWHGRRRARQQQAR